MTALLGVLGHSAFSTGFGWALLSSRRHERRFFEMLLTSFLVGMYVETLSVACLLFAGVAFTKAAMAVGIAMCAVAAALLVYGERCHVLPSREKPRWYEWLLLLGAGEKVLFALWQVVRTHTYFDDALTHWSGRARALYGGVNWSFDPNSPLFLGGDIGTKSYPLQIPIWRAMTAAIGGGWNEILSRADSFLFFVVILGALWLAIRRFTNGRPLAAAGVYIVAVLPLHAWHAAAGYADIGVEAFTVAALAALLRREFFVSGLLIAGAIWTKADGLVLYAPAFVVAVVLMQRSSVLRFLVGLATVAPWIIYNLMHHLGFTAGQGGFLAYHAAAPTLLLQALTLSAASGFTWSFLIAAAAYLSVRMLKDQVGRALFAALTLVFAAILFTFTLTSAYEFLENQMTVHRTMMQFSGMAILVLAYGASLISPASPTGATRSASRVHRGNAASRP